MVRIYGTCTVWGVLIAVQLSVLNSVDNTMVLNSLDQYSGEEQTSGVVAALVHDSDEMEVRYPSGFASRWGGAAWPR